MGNTILTAPQTIDNHDLDWRLFFQKACQYQAGKKRMTASHKALRDMAYIGYVVCEQGGYETALCRMLYNDIAARGFRATADNLTELANALASLTALTIENLDRIYYGTLDNPYYQRAAFFEALEQAMDTPATQNVKALLNPLRCARPWAKDFQNAPSAAEQSTQRLADQFKRAHESYDLPFEVKLQNSLERWQHLVQQGHSICQQQATTHLDAYEIYQGQFNHYITLHALDQRAGISTLSYGMAKMVQIALEARATAANTDIYTPFFATIEQILGTDARNALIEISKEAT